MKKLTKLMAILMALCLITSSFVGSTLAKYITTAEGNDTARVAKFGVVLEAGSEIFATEYAEDSTENTGTVAVKSDVDTENVIAPGTTGTMTAFKIGGAPEVDVKVTATLSKTNPYTMVTLPAGDDYLDWTTATVDDTYDVADNYYPVVWTLTHKDSLGNETTPVTGNLKAIQDYLTTTLSGVYEVEDDTFDAINGEYTLTWAWAFYVDEATDKKDTSLGQVAANKDTIAGTVLNETFDFAITVEQID